MKAAIASILSVSAITTLFGMFGIGATANRADAFCIYNATDKQIYFQQAEWKGMSKTIKAGDNGCCNWQTKDCNPSKKRDRMLDVASIRVVIKPRFNYAESVDCGVERYSAVGGSSIEAKLQAGGYWTVEKNKNFNPSQKYGSQNPPYLVNSWSYNHRLLSTYICPVERKGKPGLLDFLD